MPIYTCERCLKEFKQKGHLTKHMNRKNPCQEVKSKLESMVQSAVESKVENIIIEKKLISKQTENEEATTDMETQSKDKINFDKMNVKQLQDICRKNDIKGFSGKKREVLVQFVMNSLDTAIIPVNTNTNKIICDKTIVKTSNNEVQQSKKSLKFIDLFSSISSNQVVSILCMFEMYSCSTYVNFPSLNAHFILVNFSSGYCMNVAL